MQTPETDGTAQAVDTTVEGLRAKLIAAFEPEYFELEDTSDGCGSKFEMIVVAAKFEGMGLLDRQRAVNGCLEEEMKVIHAMSMKTWAPAQASKKMEDYEARKAAFQGA